MTVLRGIGFAVAGGLFFAASVVSPIFPGVLFYIGISCLVPAGFNFFARRLSHEEIVNIRTKILEEMLAPSFGRIPVELQGSSEQYPNFTQAEVIVASYYRSALQKIGLNKTMEVALQETKGYPAEAVMTALKIGEKIHRFFPVTDYTYTIKPLLDLAMAYAPEHIDRASTVAIGYHLIDHKIHPLLTVTSLEEKIDTCLNTWANDLKKNIILAPEETCVTRRDIKKHLCKNALCWMEKNYSIYLKSYAMFAEERIDHMENMEGDIEKYAAAYLDRLAEDKVTLDRASPISDNTSDDDWSWALDSPHPEETEAMAILFGYENTIAQRSGGPHYSIKWERCIEGPEAPEPPLRKNQ